MVKFHNRIYTHNKPPDIELSPGCKRFLDSRKNLWRHNAKMAKRAKTKAEKKKAELAARELEKIARKKRAIVAKRAKRWRQTSKKYKIWQKNRSAKRYRTPEYRRFWNACYAKRTSKKLIKLYHKLEKEKKRKCPRIRIRILKSEQKN